jgi:hypothetical protein
MIAGTPIQVRVNAKESNLTKGGSDLFPRFASRAILQRLVPFHAAPWQVPVGLVRVLNKQDLLTPNHQHPDADRNRLEKPPVQPRRKE